MNSTQDRKKGNGFEGYAPEQLVNIRKAGKLLGCSYETVRKRLEEGTIEAQLEAPAPERGRWFSVGYLQSMAHVFEDRRVSGFRTKTRADKEAGERG